MFQEFKDFIAKGNVLDLAVAVVLGAAFGKIVTALVNNVLMPPIGYVMGGKNFNDLQYVLEGATKDAPAVAIKYGAFVQSIIDFLIIAFVIFLVVKAYNKMTKKQAEEAGPTSEELLTDIRDILKKQ